MRIIDTHCHLYDEAFAADLPSVVEKCRLAGVVSAVNNADSLEAFEKILSLQERFPDFFLSALGIHPEFATKEDAYLERAYEEIRLHAADIVAVGEIGLDYHYDRSPETKARQRKVFRDQIRLAKELSLPIVVHSRDADQETFDILREELPPRVDLHCYSGSVELLREYLRLPFRFSIGIGGVVTFKNARVIKEVVKEAPLSSLLSETDAPYLTPTPYRGQRNDPSYLPLVLQEIASLRQQDVEEIGKALHHNAEVFYGRER